MTTRTYFTASCDGCGAKYEYDDAGGIIHAETTEQLDLWLSQTGWLDHDGRLLCDEGCIDTLNVDGHDFVTTLRSEPFCAICKRLPDAAHPNVPMLGQTGIEVA